MQKNQVSETAGQAVETFGPAEHYEDLLDWEDTYEIGKEYPHPIRRKKDKRIINEWYNDGYKQVYLNDGVKIDHPYHHDLVALQWIYNDDPEHKIVVDHVNHIRDDNRIENLIWCTQSKNCRNKSSHKGIDYEFVDIDDISDEAIDVLDYGNHQFADEDYIYDPPTDSFYYFNGQQYRKLYINKNTKTGALYVYMRDIHNNRVNVSYNKFKKLYGFI